MDAFITIGGAIMGIDPWAEGRNLAKMGLDGLACEDIMGFLLTGE